MKRKLVLLVLCLCLCFTLVGCGDKDPELTETSSTPAVSENAIATVELPEGKNAVGLQTVTAKPGEQVTIAAIVSENLNVAAADFDVKFDSALLNYKECATGAVAEGSLSTGALTGAGEFHFTMATLDPVVESGTLFTVTFTVSDDVPVGEIPLELVCETFCDTDFNDIEVTCINGSVVVK